MQCVMFVQAMYIRVKRSKRTYFIHCDPTETILDIKQKLEVLIDKPVLDQQLILFGSGEVLEDSKTLADQKVSYQFHDLFFISILCAQSDVHCHVISLGFCYHLFVFLLLVECIVTIDHDG